MQTRTYLALLTALTLLGFSGVAVFNYVVDPYRYFDSADRPGINKYRQRFFLGQYLTKPYALRERAPEAVILGVSRAGSSLATDHPGWEGTSVYNYGMAGSTAYLLWRNYQHAKGTGNLKQVLLMLDFYMYNAFENQRPEVGHVRGYEERLTVTSQFTPNRGFPVRHFKDNITSLLSFEMFHESWNTIIAQRRIANEKLYRATLTPSGFWINDPPPHYSQRRLFHHVERQYMTTTWFPKPKKKFALYPAEGNSNMDYLRLIIADAHRADIDLRLAFMPFHARLGEALHAVELWDDFERWKIDVVSIVEEQAQLADRTAFSIWDFTGYNSITTEPVPAADDLETRMKWHLDATHVSRSAGFLMQTVMLGTEGERYPDFGQLVNSENIRTYIDTTRERRKRYIDSFPEEREEVLLRYTKTAAWREAN